MGVSKVYETDQEQIEAIKAWWNENANWVIGAFIALIASYGGVQWYQGAQEAHRLAGSEQFDSLLTLVADADVDADARQALVADIKNEYDDLGYGPMAALLEAKAQVESGNLEAALAELTWAEGKADAELLPVVLYRKALVQFEQGEFSAALASLDAIKVTGHEAVSQELRGDILLAQGDEEGARKAYQAALDASAEQGINNPYVAMKLNELASAE